MFLDSEQNEFVEYVSNANRSILSDLVNGGTFEVESDDDDDSEPVIRRGRGRPRKMKSLHEEPVIKRGRGRPRKY